MRKIGQRDDDRRSRTFMKNLRIAFIFGVPLKVIHLAVMSVFQPLIIEIDRKRRRHFRKAESLKASVLNVAAKGFGDGGQGVEAPLA